MKIIHIPFCFHPDPVGGTEVYMEALARHLQELGTEVLVAAPTATARWRHEATSPPYGMTVLAGSRNWRGSRRNGPTRCCCDAIGER